MIPIENTSSSTKHYWCSATKKRLNLVPGVNEVEDSLFDYFKKQIFAEPVLQPVQENEPVMNLNDTVETPDGEPPIQLKSLGLSEMNEPKPKKSKTSKDEKLNEDE
jgi:hypothetical protein